MMILKLIAGPLIGSVIGYFTNYIAVKMLFKPLRPVYIGKKQLPFTPGLIPKRKDQLAEAVGRAVSEKLLTGEDLAQALPVDSIKSHVADHVWEQFEALKEKEETVKEIGVKYISGEKYDQLSAELEDVFTRKTVDAVRDMNIGDIIVREGVRVLNEKVQGTMVGMFLNEQTINSFAAPLGEEIEKFIDEHGEAMIRPAIAGQIKNIEEHEMGDLASRIPLEKKNIYKLVDTVYERCMSDSFQNIMEEMDIAGIVESKIKDMEVERLEELVLSVMKKDLDAIVNLGAVIGFVIGILNTAINML
ncbi:MAG: DUF445 family protein [Firmicutes bacterium]|nr:DUF445 family protein [Bacillota bacterium]